MRIAIVKLSALGDIVHAMVVLQYIKDAIPDARLDWFVEKRFSDVLGGNPHVDRVHTVRLKGNKLGFWREYKKLKMLEPYDVVIDMQGLIKSAIVSRVLSRRVVGFDRHSLRESFASFFYTKKFAMDYGANVIVRNVSLVCFALGIKMPKIEHKRSFLYSHTQAAYRPTLLLIVGSSWRSKIYPKEHFVSIVKALHVETFVAWGSESERESAKFIAEHTQASMLPRLSLDELKSVIMQSRLVIGADSGPTHMAWASNRASITIFGPTPSERNSFVSDINLVVDCGKKIDANALDKGDMCIESIDYKRIVELAKGVLG